MTDYSQLPEWTCHKVVRAAKIEAVDLAGRADGPQNTIQVVVADRDGTRTVLDVPYAVTARETPRDGDYLVVYDKGPDGEPYVSWSPAAVFEDGYSLGRRATFLPLDEQTPLGPGVPRSRAPNEAFAKFVNETFDSPSPTIGRIVHYQAIQGGRPVPMMIAEVHDQGGVMTVSGPFFAFGFPLHKSWLDHISEGDGVGQWRWPERVG